jgi:DNA polymerase-3 subunit alpha (Gram-positive type)
MFIINWLISLYRIIMNFLEKIDEPYINNNNIIYFDFETTGLNPFCDKIIEYAFIKENGQPNDNMERKIDYITSLVNPNVKLSQKIKDITKINDSMLTGKQTINKKIKKINKFLEDAKGKKYLVAHNALAFDKIFLNENLKLIDENYDYSNIIYIDTLLLARKLLPNLNGGYSMFNLSKYYNIESGNHRAINDTLSLRLLFHKLVETMEEKNIHTKNDIMNYPELLVEYIGYN